MFGDGNLLSFHLVLLGLNFHFHTRKALTSGGVACLDGHSSCWHCFPLNCSLSHCTTATWSEIPWCYQNANQKFSCCCFTRQKTPGECKRLGSSGLSSLPFPSCQDTRPFICSALTHWAALAENMTGEMLSWTIQVTQNSTCRLVSVISQITVKDSSWGFNWYSCRNI